MQQHVHCFLCYLSPKRRRDRERVYKKSRDRPAVGLYGAITPPPITSSLYRGRAIVPVPAVPEDSQSGTVHSFLNKIRCHDDALKAHGCGTRTERIHSPAATMRPTGCFRDAPPEFFPDPWVPRSTGLWKYPSQRPPGDFESSDFQSSSLSRRIERQSFVGTDGRAVATDDLSRFQRVLEMPL